MHRINACGQRTWTFHHSVRFALFLAHIFDVLFNPGAEEVSLNTILMKNYRFSIHLAFLKFQIFIESKLTCCSKLQHSRHVLPL